jgi:WD40 repeat protein
MTDHGSVAAVRYLADGESLVTAGRDGTLVRWSADGASHRELGRIVEPVDALQRKPDSDILVASTSTGRLWKLEGERLAVLDGPQNIESHVFSRDGRWLAAVSHDGELWLYDAQTWECRARLVGFSGVRVLEFSAAGDRLAIGTRASVQLIDIAHVLHGGSPADRAAGMPWNKLDLGVFSIAFSPDGHWLGMTDETGAIWFYSFDRGTWVCEVSRGQIFSGYFSPDSRHFIATDPNGRVLLIDMATVVQRTAS